MTKVIISYMFVFLLCGEVLSQALLHTRQKISPPTEEMQLKAMIYSIVQSVRQCRPEILVELLDERISDGLEENIDREQIKIRMEKFFSNTETRNNDSLWSRMNSNRSMPTSWDFYVTSAQIMMKDSLAQANFQIGWLLDIPLTTKSSRPEVMTPAQKRDETVYFRKIRNRWKIVGFETLLKMMKYCNNPGVRFK